MRNHYGDIFTIHFWPGIKVGDVLTRFNGTVILKVIDVDWLSCTCYAQAVLTP